MTLSLGNAPAGVTGSFTPAAPTGTSATLTLSVGAGVAPGVYNLTVNGSGSAGDRSTPLTLDVSIKLAAVSEGYEHSCALATTGAAYCWGYNSNGQLGDGTTTQRLVPTAAGGGLTFAAVSAGGQMTCGVTTNGEAYCWPTGSRRVPTPVAFP